MAAGVSRDQVLAALDRLLGWPPLARSPQLASLLAYIVRKTLDGEEAGIKAYAIAVDVFGRPASFDPQTDPIVRVQARRLRALLEQFYAEQSLADGEVRITLPTGRYVPEFLAVDGSPGTSAPDQSVAPEAQPPPPGAVPSARALPIPRRSNLLRPLLASIVLLLIAGIAFLPDLLAPKPTPPTPPPEAVAVDRPERPSLAVGAFANLTNIAATDGFGGLVARELTALLSPFEDFAVLAGEGEPAAAPALGYVVSGLVNPDPAGIQITGQLTLGGETIWTRNFTQPVPGPDAVAAARLAARAIAREIAPYRGPLNASARAWLDAQQRPLPVVSPYICLLTYRLARETGAPGHLADALVCHERLLAVEPDLPVAIACHALLETRSRLDQMRPGDDVRALLADPLARAQRALAVAPDSSLIQGILGSIHNWRNEFAESQQAFAEALRLNPLDTDARAAYAIALSRGPDWALGSQQAAIAIADTPYPSPWYYFPVVASAWRAGDYEAALRDSLLASGYASGEAGTVMALAAAGMLNRADVIAELRSRVLTLERLRLWGIEPWLRTQSFEADLVQSIAAGLRRAGIAEDALTGPF